MDDQVPRLPPRPPPDQATPTPQPTEPVRRPSLVEFPVRPLVPTDLPPYDEPSLVGVGGGAFALVVTRGLVALWAIAVAVVTVVLRVRAEDGATSTEPVTILSWIGAVLICLVAAAGWWWSDRYAVDIHRLGGRLPARVRCATAWLTPLLWTVLLAVTIARVDPTEGVDVRPAILVTIFVVAMWRPYSLCRRLIRSLTRLPSDVVVGTAYVFDLAGFGLIWWQLSSWPRPLGPESAGEVDALVGIGLASAVALTANAALWPMIARDVRKALLHRRVARRTQHDHKHLRLRGIDPMDPTVRWALLKIHRDDLAEEERRLEHAAHGVRDVAAKAADDVWALGDAGGPPLDSPAGLGRARLDARRRSTAAGTGASARGRGDRRWVRDAIVSDTASDGPAREAPSAEVVAAEPTDTAATVDAADTPDTVDDAASAETTGPTTPAAPDAPDAPDDAREVAVEDAAERDVAAASTDDVSGDDDVAPTRRRRSGQAPSLAALSPESEAGGDDPADPDNADDRLNRALQRIQSSDEPAEPAGTDRLDRISSRLTNDELSAEQRRLDRIAERLAATGGVRGPANLMDRLAQYGISPTSTPIQTDPVLETVDPDRPVMRRIVYLELVRYLMLLSIAAATGAAAWLVVRAASAGVENGEISPAGVDSIELVRHVVFGALTAMLAIVPWWALAVSVAGRRFGDGDTGGLRALVAVLATVSTSACVVGFAVDAGRSGLSLVAVVVGVVCSVAAVEAVPRIDHSLAGSSSTLRVWGVLIALVPFALWSGQLGRPVEATDQLESIIFFAALLTMLLGVALVLAAVATGAVEERLRFAGASAGHDDESGDGAGPDADRGSTRVQV